MEWVVVILIRLLVPLTILRWNLAGSILAIIADNLDVVIADMLGVTDFSPYSRIDKSLDIYFYLIQGYTLLFWQNKFAKRLGLFLLGYRLLGTVLFEITNIRLLLFIFPNLFIFFFMYYLVFRKIMKREPFTTMRTAWPVLAVLLVAKLGQEYMLHVAEFPIYDWLLQYIPFI